MSPKDHYRTLGIAPNASLKEIKKAYRNLAHKFHPDKNPDNTFAVHHFHEIQEAYKILSDDKTRRQYDEERYFAGLSAQKEPSSTTGAWILKQTRQLSTHMHHVDSYRMNHSALHDYILLLLSDSHLAVLEQEQNADTNQQIVEELLSATKRIRFEYFVGLVQRMSLLTANNEVLQQRLALEYFRRRKEAQGQRFLPLLVIIVTIILCVLMYLYSRQRL